MDVPGSKEFRYAYQLEIGDYFRRLEDTEEAPERVMGYGRDSKDFPFAISTNSDLLILVNRNDQPFEVELDPMQIVQYFSDTIRLA